MPGVVPPQPPLVTSALALGLDAFTAIKKAIAGGVADARSSFELTLGAASPDWGFAVLAGVEPLIDALERLRVKLDELDWLTSVGAIDGPTRRRLADLRFACDVDVAPEGSTVFPGEAVVVVEGPFWQAQLVGGLVLAAITDATAVATRFARLSLASRGAEIVEDGSASAHRLGGTPTLARAAYVGGAHATTNALAARRYGLPVTASRPELLDERTLLELRADRIAVLSFAANAGAAVGVQPKAQYDLVAIEDAGAWAPRMRLGPDVASSSDPGRKLLVRYTDAEGRPVADIAHSSNERFVRAHGGRFIDCQTGLEDKLAASTGTPLRGSVMRAGRRATPSEPAAVLRDRARTALQALGEEHRRIASPARYRVGISPQLAALKTELLERSSSS